MSSNSKNEQINIEEGEEDEQSCLINNTLYKNSNNKSKSKLNDFETKIKFNDSTSTSKSKSLTPQLLQRSNLIEKEFLNNDYTSIRILIRRQIKEHRLRRQRLTIQRQPFRCFTYCVFMFWEYVREKLVQMILTYKIQIMSLLLLVCGYLMLRSSFLISINKFRIIDFQIFERFEEEVRQMVQQIVLGILSSIGLGTGIHSGVLFLFPQIARVCMCASECKTLNFRTHGYKAFECPSTSSNVLLVNKSSNTNFSLQSSKLFQGLFAKIFQTCFLQGSGTAIGEIPPYQVSYAAAQSKYKHTSNESEREVDKLLLNEECDSDDQIDDNSEDQSREENFEFGDGRHSITSQTSYCSFNFLYRQIGNILAKSRHVMFKLLHRYGFQAILLFASQPNVAFDLCGIACGHFMLPFSNFFAATFIGKALIKVNLQAAFFITIFNDHLLDKFLSLLSILNLEKLVREFILDQKAHFHHSTDDKLSNTPQSSFKHTEKTPLLSKIFNFILIIFLLFYFASVISSLARKRQKDLDMRELRVLKQSFLNKRLKSQVSKSETPREALGLNKRDQAVYQRSKLA